MDLSQLTLREWYGNHFMRLYHADARQGTTAQYRNTLTIWERVTKNPRIDEVTPYTLADFRQQCPGSPASIAKHARHLNHLFAKLGPPGPRNRNALGILPTAPWIQPPRVDGRTPRIPSDDQLEHWIRHAPIDLALFAVIAATTGSRRIAILALTPTSLDGERVLHFPASTDKRRRERLKPIPQITDAWLKRHGATMDRWRTNANSFSHRWARYAAKLNVSTLRPHGLKRWWAAQLIRAGASPWCVKYALDHAQNDVTGMSYLQPFDELATLVDAIPLPTAFQARLRHETQTTLPF